MTNQIAMLSRQEIFDRLTVISNEIALLTTEIGNTAIGETTTLEEMVVRRDYLTVVFTRLYNAIECLQNDFLETRGIRYEW